MDTPDFDDWSHAVLPYEIYANLHKPVNGYTYQQVRELCEQAFKAGYNAAQPKDWYPMHDHGDGNGRHAHHVANGGHGDHANVELMTRANADPGYIGYTGGEG